MRKLLLAAALVALPQVARASDPVGVYGIVTDVVRDNKAATAQLWGWFAPFDTKTGSYQKPQRGFMYYACPKGSEDVCALEWSDLEKSKGASGCAAFGSRRDPVTFQYRDNGRVRDPALGVIGEPDSYPIAQGVSQVAPSANECSNLETASAGQPAPTPTPNPNPQPNPDPGPGTGGPGLQTGGCAMGGGGAELGGLASLTLISLALWRARRRR